MDEPLFTRFPERAGEYAIEHVERCFHGVDPEVHRIVHVCCGYTDGLDREDYPKANAQAYEILLPALGEAAVDGLSVEYAHRPLDLRVLESLPRTMVALGVVAIARSRVKSAEEIEGALRSALQHVEPDRLMASPDCGLGLLPAPVARGSWRTCASRQGARRTATCARRPVPRRGRPLRRSAPW